ncbi:uncharacterized protein [Nicotiana tomentosiformis]|uniref:uncharacterized protein n=1 Tax=Nicotiana tomentosiformis TaxID=4098 RepID=UPI00388C54D4
MFERQIGKIMKVYIDDMLVKSLSTWDHLIHLQEIFDILRKFNMKLNPEKCTFGVGSKKFLGFLISQRVIEINSEKFKSIEDIPDQLKSTKEVQRLTSRVPTSIEGLEEVLVRSLFNVNTKGWGDDNYLFDSVGSCEYNQTQVLADFVIDFSMGMMPLAAKEAVLGVVWIHIRREDNMEVDALTNLGSSMEMKGADSCTLGPLARCLGTLEADYVIREVHEEASSNHSGADSLVEAGSFKKVGEREGLKIKRITSSPYHPCTSGQAESTNKVIIQNLKKKLEDAKASTSNFEDSEQVSKELEAADRARMLSKAVFSKARVR